MALILIVDDEHSVRAVLTRWIQAAGHETMEAESAEAALKVMEVRPAAVVFSDIQMPGHDGLWLTAELRRRYPNTAVVLATSVSSVAPSFSMQAGVLAYLVKPFRSASVRNALETALQWQMDAATKGQHEDYASERLQEWLDSLERS
jgi:ATP-dependent Lon protease